MNCEIDIRNSTIENHMNHLWTIYFHDLIVFVNSQDRISKEIMSTLTFQAFFISFLLLVFLIETSGNSISFLAVIIVDVLLVYFNHDKCYNNECIYYQEIKQIKQHIKLTDIKLTNKWSMIIIYMVKRCVLTPSFICR